MSALIKKLNEFRFEILIKKSAFFERFAILRNRSINRLRKLQLELIAEFDFNLSFSIDND